ncbi:MAG: DIP1984 family protein [Eubacteriales bacterium]|nr:DIP1984 family protein [Eubacteriales bacterium]
MKLAEALMERADLQKRLSQLKSRLSMNAKVQEGEKPAEDPETLLSELDTVIAQLETLITRINRTNAAPLAENGDAILALLARRDCLRLQTDALRDFLSDASATVMRGTKSEVVIRSTVSVAELQKKIDALAKELRELDVRIQSLNWSTELL